MRYDQGFWDVTNTFELVNVIRGREALRTMADDIHVWCIFGRVAQQMDLWRGNEKGKICSATYRYQERPRSNVRL